MASERRRGLPCPGGVAETSDLVLLEIAAVPPGLDRQEGGIKADRDKDQEVLLREGERRARRGLGVVGQDQAQHDQRDDHAEVGVGALEVVLLLAVPPSPEQE